MGSEGSSWAFLIHHYYITTIINPAPDNLLKVIACNCTGDCSSLNCGCRRGGYSCTYMCGECQVKECTIMLIPLLKNMTEREQMMNRNRNDNSDDNHAKKSFFLIFSFGTQFFLNFCILFAVVSAPTQNIR